MFHNNTYVAMHNRPYFLWVARVCPKALPATIAGFGSMQLQGGEFKNTWQPGKCFNAGPLPVYNAFRGIPSREYNAGTDTGWYQIRWCREDKP